MSSFQQLLESVLDDISGQKSRPELENISEEYLEVIQKIDRVKAQLEELYNVMVTLEKKTLSTIATAIKSDAPKIDLNLDHNRLQMGDDCATCDIRPINGMFKLKTDRDSVSGNPIEIFNHLLSTFVPEHKNGHGRVMIEGRRATTVDLYNYKESI